MPLTNGDTPAVRSRRPSMAGPAMQVICLASGGGPNEDNTTAFLVRSLSTNWRKNSVLAVDAGSHLSSITRILAEDFPMVSPPPQSSTTNGTRAAAIAVGESVPDDSSVVGDEEDFETPEVEEVQPKMTILNSGPFAGLPFPNESARANALHVVRECIATYLITHPHLDHLAGFVVNTAGLASTSRPKTVAALPSTVQAIKTHIFNDIIWPNLTDEDGGVGFVTFQRLPQGGNNMVGEGLGKGYIEVVDGLCVRGVKVSHGCCLRPGALIGGGNGGQGKRDSEVGLSDPTQLQQQQQQQQQMFHSFSGMESPHKGLPGEHGSIASAMSMPLSRRTPSITQLQFSTPGTPSFFPQQSGYQHSSLLPPQPPTALHTHTDPNTHRAVVDSTAYFIRDDPTGREVLIFGDVEPDSLSLNPRTRLVWAEAAPKIVAGSLRAVFIECSYDDSQGDAVLFGHLCPRHLVKEIGVLAGMVRDRKREEKERRDGRKRKRSAQRAMQQAGNTSVGDAASTTSRPSISNTDTTVASSVAPTSVDLETEPSGIENLAKRRVTKPPRLANMRSAKHLMNDFNPSPMDLRGTPTPSAPASRNGESLTRGNIAAPLLPPSPAQTPSQEFAAAEKLEPEKPPLQGLKIVVIHMKDTHQDGPLVGERIMEQLVEHERVMREGEGDGKGWQGDGVGLGVEWVISRVGESYWV